MMILQSSINFANRLHDLWILLAWAGILTGLMLNTFYNRNCFEFQMARNSTVTCQSGLDIGLMMLASIGAGMTFTDERVAYVGFIPAHAIASILFVTVVALPSIMGLTDPVFFNLIVANAFLLAFKSQLPFPIFFSFIGAFAGVYLGGKIRG